MKRRTLLGGAVLGWAALAACGQNQIPTPQRSLDRPTDLAVGCVLGTQTAVDQPITWQATLPWNCNGSTTTSSQPFLGAPVRLLGFIPNSATGEVAVAGLIEGDSAAAVLIDLDPGLPGFNFLPVGRLPSVAETTADGCRVVVVDEGSCDFASIGVAEVANAAQHRVPVTGAVTLVTPTTSAGPILAKPHTLVLKQPLTTPPTTPTSAVPSDCSAGSAAPYHAYVAFPACDLVAEIDLSSGAYVRGVFVRDTGVTDAGPAPVCPLECTDKLAATDGGAPPSAPAATVMPVALAIRQDGSTLFVGGSLSRKITALDIDPATGAFGNIRQLELDACPPPPTVPASPPQLGCDPMGISRLRLGPPGGPTLGGPSNDAGEFLYAAALDATVRVVKVDELRECETQGDPQVIQLRYPPSPSQPNYCLPIDEVTQPRLRRSTAVGPGIRTGGVPVDIVFAGATAAGTAGPLLLSGTFAYVLGSNGVMTVVNLDTKGDEPIAAIPHQVHNKNISSPGTPDPNGDPTGGGARVDPATLSALLPTNIGADLTAVPALATIAHTCGDPLNRGPGVPAVHFPDVVPVRPESWSFGYEGGLPDQVRSGGVLSGDTPVTMTLADGGARFCGHGVEPGDFVILAACQDSTQCPIGEDCFFAIGGRSGICLLSSQGANGPEPPPACLDLRNSRREFRAARAYDGTLVLDERPLVLPRAGGCTSDADCANIDDVPNITQHLFPTGPGFVCDPVPWPGTTVRQCVKACDPPGSDGAGGWVPHDDECVPDATLLGAPTAAGLYSEFQGAVCGHETLGSAFGPTCTTSDQCAPYQTCSNGRCLGLRRCVSARVPRDPAYDIDPRVGDNVTNDCFQVGVGYEVHVGLALLALGSVSGMFHHQTTAADGTCVPDLSHGTKRVSRLSYNDPFCPPSFPADYDDGTLIGSSTQGPICIWDATKPPLGAPLPGSGEYVPNPCLRVYTFPGMGAPPPVLVWNMQNPVFEVAVGPAARLSNFGTGFGTTYAFTFTVAGGFAPLATATSAFFPAALRVLPGGPPLNSEWIYVLDEGDQISPTLRIVLQGQVLRFHSDSLALDPITQVQ